MADTTSVAPELGLNEIQLCVFVCSLGILEGDTSLLINHEVIEISCYALSRMPKLPL